MCVRCVWAAVVRHVNNLQTALPKLDIIAGCGCRIVPKQSIVLDQWKPNQKYSLLFLKTVRCSLTAQLPSTHNPQVIGP